MLPAELWGGKEPEITQPLRLDELETDVGVSSLNRVSGSCQSLMTDGTAYLITVPAAATSFGEFGDVFRNPNMSNFEQSINRSRKNRES